MRFPLKDWLRVSSRAATLAALFCLGSSSVLAAPAPCVHFDVPDTVKCRPYEQGGFREADDDLLVVANFSISTLVRVGHEEEKLQLLFVLESPERTMRVVDYSPKTELFSTVTGEIEYQRQSEHSSEAGLNASFQVPPALNGDAKLSSQSRTNENLKYHQMPPLQLLAASGTIARGSAVYFKLKPSPRTSLEGVRDFQVVFQVPRSWRADYLRLRCVAYEQGSHDHGRDGDPICGSSDFLVPLYLAGDDAARSAAEELARGERQLRHLARLQAERQNRQDTQWSHKLPSWLGGKSQPRFPAAETWLTAVLQSPARQVRFSFQSQLPEEIQEGLRSFTQARQAIYALHDHRPAAVSEPEESRELASW